MAKIVIFDSGVGGLSIYQAVKSYLPEHSYVFVSDNQGFPYGTKAEGELTERVIHVVDRIIKKEQPDIFIVACNTASTVVLPHLRKKYAIEFVGVVPAIKPAVQVSQSKVVGLLATPATIERQYTHDLIKQFAEGCEIVKVGSAEMVELAESKLLGVSIDMSRMESILMPFLAQKQLDTLVLSCTHFPLLNKEIESIFDQKNHPVKLIDSATAIARRVQVLIEQNTRLSILPETQVSKVQTTKAFVKSSYFESYLAELGFSEVGLL